MGKGQFKSCSAGEGKGEKGGGAPALTRLTSRLAALGRLLIRQGRGLAVLGGVKQRAYEIMVNGALFGWRKRGLCDWHRSTQIGSKGSCLSART